MPSARYTIIIDAELSGAERARAILEQLKQQTAEGLDQLTVAADTRQAEDAKDLIVELERAAETPATIALDAAPAIAQAERLSAEIDRVLADRQLKVSASADPQSANQQSASSDQQSSGLAEAAQLAALQDLQEQAAKGLPPIKIEADPAPAQALKRELEDIDKLAADPTEYHLDTQAAASQADDLKSKIEAIGAAGAKETPLSVNADPALKGADRVADAIEDLQERARRGLAKLDLQADPKAADELKKIIEDIDALAARPKTVRIDIQDALRDAKALDKRLDTLGKRDPGKVGFLARLKGDLKDLRTEIPLIGKGFDLLAIAARGPVAILVGSVAALALAWKGARAAFSAYLAEAPKFAELDAVLAQHGQLTDQIRQRYIGMASALQDLTGIADDRWIEVISRLIQFGSKPESIGVDIEAVKNLTGIFKGDATRAADLYSRALQGQFGQFAELGIVIDQNASQTQKLAQLQREAADKGAGILEAKARSAAGSVQALGNEMGDLVEGFGRLIARNSVVQAFFGGLRNAVRAVVSLLPEAVDKLEGLENKLPDLRAEFEATTDSVETFTESALKKQTEAADAATAAISRATAALQAYITAQLAVNDAKLGEDLAQIDLALSKGEISPEEAAAKRYGLRREADDRRDALEAQKTAAALLSIDEQRKAKLQPIGTNAAQLNDLTSRREALNQQFGFDLNLSDRLKAEQAAIKEEREAIEEGLKQASEELAPLQQRTVLTGVPFRPKRQLSLLREKDFLQDRQQQLEARSAELEDFRPSLNRPEVNDARTEIKSINTSISAATASLQKAKEDYANFEKSVAEQETALKIQLATQRRVAAIEKRTAETKREIEVVGETEAAAALEAEAAAKDLSERASTFSGSYELTRNQGPNAESDSEFRARKSRADTLASEVRSAGAALADGATPDELKQLAAAVQDLVRTIGQNRENRQTQNTLAQLRSDIQRLDAQLRALRQ